jgi:lipopolysaccharide/colanic/teichoic acid biosynthesis glycosyltransferase
LSEVEEAVLPERADRAFASWGERSRRGESKNAGRAEVAWAAARRAVDILGASILLFILAPFMVAVALAIKLDSRGPVFYRCRRVGFRGQLFSMVKFRKMHVGAEGPPITGPDDDRFTRIGRLLSATKIDELPQIWNVLKGQMTFVGPRPEDPYFVALHADEYADILTVKPGMTGLSQLAFANERALLSGSENVQTYVERVLPQKMAIDRLYVASRSFPLDLNVLLWTAILACTHRSIAVHRETARLTFRKRPKPTLEDALSEATSHAVTAATAE